MSIKSIKGAVLGIVAVAAVAITATFAGVAPAAAAGAVQVPAITTDAATTSAVQNVHYRSYYHRHGYNNYRPVRRYKRRYRNNCRWVNRRFYDRWEYRYYYKRVKVCSRVYY